MKTLDITGLSCPEPVVRTMAALKGMTTGESIAVLVDTATARDNVVRVAGSAGYEVSVEAEGKQYRLTIKKP